MTENRRAMNTSRTTRIVTALAGPLLAAATAYGAPAAVHPGSRPGGVESVGVIRAAAAAFVRSQLPASEVARINVGSLDDRLRLPRCAAPLQVAPIAGTQDMANSTISVSCARPAMWKIFVPVTVVRRIAVLMLRHAVARGSHLTSADVLMQVREVTGFTVAFLGSPAQLAGRSTEQTLPAGTLLTADMFSLDPVIVRGQQVTLVVQANGFEVRAEGRALGDAHVGEQLNVENLNSQKVVQGVAEPSGIVQVED